jgi:predicted amidophosphoribosyltransferase
VATNYDGVITKLLWDLKYESKIAAARALANLISPILVLNKVEGLSPNDFDIVTAIPATPGRYRKRSYHQAELIARSLAKNLGLPYRPLLGRFEAPSQVGASRDVRLERVKGTFWAKRPQYTTGQRVLVIDDVLTTGATLDEAANVLDAAGATKVWGAVVAKH